MTEESVSNANLSPERRTALEREASQLQQDQTRNARWSLALLLLGVASFITAGIAVGRTGPLFAQWFFLLSGYFLIGLAVAIDAIRKGHSPAWGLLSGLGLIAVEFLPNRELRRYDTITQELEGKPSSHALYEDLENISFVPFWGIYVTLRSRRMARERGIAVPPFHVVVAVLSTAVPLILAGVLLWYSQTDEIAQGKLSFIRLPPGWVDVTTSHSDNPKVDVAAKSRKAFAEVIVVPSRKDGYVKLEDFAEATLATRQKALGALFGRSGPTIRTVGDRRRVEYVFQGHDERSGEIVEILTFWETPGYFWFALGTASQASYGVARDELQFAADNVYSLD